MQKRFSLLLAAFWLCVTLIQSQTNFRDSLEKSDPVAPGAALALEEKRKIHQGFLDDATQTGNRQKRFYGFLFLFKDYVQSENYPEATRCLLEAEALAQAAANPAWQGGVLYRKGILSVYLKKYQEALSHYEAAIRFCAAARDSLCLGENLEQISSMYGRIGNYSEAHHYFDLAMPLLTRFGGDLQVCTALNNFGNLLALQERPAEAIPYFERALSINESKGDPRRTAQFLSNLADSYCQLGRHEQALSAYRRCISINQQHKWSENLVFNYRGIAVVYEETGDFRLAFDFFKQYHYLHDSLVGRDTQEKIAELQVQYETKQKELALQQNQTALSLTQRSLERRTLLACTMLMLVALGGWRWRLQSQQANRERLQHQQSLSDLTSILMDKNTQLAALEQQILAPPPPIEVIAESTVETNLYNHRILTHSDWAAFKSYFEKAYPGYLLRIRTAYPMLSDAEERLLLFIKLNLTRQEAAAILGISTDSVKKTRNRLRKRLGLEQEEDLDELVRSF